jgi:hypothetical protein
MGWREIQRNLFALAACHGARQGLMLTLWSNPVIRYGSETSPDLRESLRQTPPQPLGLPQDLEEGGRGAQRTGAERRRRQQRG